MRPTADRPSVVPNDGGPRAWAVTGCGRARPATPPVSHRARNPNNAVRCCARANDVRANVYAAPTSRCAMGSSAGDERAPRSRSTRAGRCPHRAAREWEGQEGAVAQVAEGSQAAQEELSHAAQLDLRKTSGAPAVLAAKRPSARFGLAQWQQIGFRCSSEGPDGSETDFGAVTSRQKATSARNEAKFRCKNNRIDSRCGFQRPQTLWERDKRHPQNVLTAPKLVSLPAHSAKLLRNLFYCQKGPKVILVTRLAPPQKAGSRPGRLPTRKTRRTSFPRRHKRPTRSWGADKPKRPNSKDSGISPCSATSFGPSKRRGAARA